MRFLGRTAAACAVAGTALAIGACGSSKSSSSSGGGAKASGSNVVDIYSSLPLQGAVTAQTDPMVNGIKLALAEANNKAGKFTVNYISMDDSTATSAATTCDVNQSQANARRAATDPKAVYYIGEFNSGCSKVTIPILNQAGIPQVSPANTYVGLTTNDPGSAPGEPQKYYPTSKRTYLRIVPRDSLQATDGLITMKHDGCKRVAVANDKTAYGAGLAQQVVLHHAAYGLTTTGDTALDPTAPNFRAYASTIKGQGVDCVYTGFNPTGEVQLVKDINAALPKARIYGGDGVCNTDITNPKKGGFPATIAPLFQCTQPAIGLSAQPGGSVFIAAYKAKYGIANPDPYSIDGYEDMKLALDTIAGLGPNGNNRGDVLAALFAITARHSVIGTYGFDKNGDTTLKSFGLYKVGPDGNTLFERAVG